MEKKFPSRQVTTFLDTRPTSFSRTVEAFGLEPELNTFLEAMKSSSVLKSMVIGIDDIPRPMPDDEINALGDKFSQHVLLAGKLPLKLSELITDIEAIQGDDALPIRKMFVIAEGGQLKLKDPAIELSERLVFTWQKNTSSAPDIFLSTLPVANSENSLIQLISWSDTDNEFHFFERQRGIWFWVGKSSMAFLPETRGKGPFDGHVNGGLVMKELKFPWVHWHSQSASIPREAFGKDSEFNTNPLFSIITGAQTLENIVKSGIRRWTLSRIRKDLDKAGNNQFLNYSRQILTSTTVNLISSSMEFSRLNNNEVFLPSTAFLDLDGIETCVFKIDPFALVIPEKQVVIEGIRYLKATQELQMHILSNSKTDLVDGDTHFAFTVPERAFEDSVVIEQLREKDILSARLCLCLLMVDFQNPISSVNRSSLIKYFPTNLLPKNQDSEIVSSLENSPNINLEGSPENLFLSYWNDKNLLRRIKVELEGFIDGLQKTIETDQGLHSLLLLMESRKNFFRIKNLHEFPSTISELAMDTSSINLAITPNGQIL